MKKLARKKIYSNEIYLNSKLTIDLSITKVYVIADVPYEENHWTRVFKFNDQLYVARCTQTKSPSKVINVIIESNKKHDPSVEDRILDILRYELGLDETMKALKREAKKDLLIDLAVRNNPGFRIFANVNAIEVVILTMISQNTSFFSYLELATNLVKIYGETVPWDKKLRLFPTNEVIANMKVEDWKKIGLSYKAKYLVNLTEEDLVNIETFAYYPILKRGLAKLKEIKGIGDYTARCLTTYHSRRYEYPIYDTYVQEVLQHKYGVQGFNNMRNYDNWIGKKWKKDPALILHALMQDYLPAFLKTRDYE